MQASIYKIVGPDGKKTYVGSCTVPLRRRLTNHQSDARTGKPMKLYDAMRAEGPERFTIHELSVVNVADRYTAEGAAVREHRGLDGVELLNVYTPGRSKAERRRAWRAAHPEAVRAQRARHAARKRAATCTAVVVYTPPP